MKQKQAPTATIAYDRDDYRGFERAVLQEIAAGKVAIVDLDGLEVLEISDMRSLVMLLRRCRTAGSELSVVTSNPAIREAFAKTGLDRVLTVVSAKAA